MSISQAPGINGVEVGIVGKEVHKSGRPLEPNPETRQVPPKNRSK